MKALSIRLGILAAVLAVIIIIGTIGFSLVEHLSISEAFYFTIVTVATVGYGDITPLTVGGRVLSVILIVVGVGAFTGVIVDGSGYLLVRRQAVIRRERTNVLVGLFMSEIGTPLLGLLSCADTGLADIHSDAQLGQEWTEDSFLALKKKLSRHSFKLEPQEVRLEALRDLLEKKTDILLRLLENPVLMEREEFTETLRSTAHLREEILARPALRNCRRRM